MNLWLLWLLCPKKNRRMQDMMKMYSMYGMDSGMFAGQETLVLNEKHPLVAYILENSDSENVPILCQQLYDLAMLSHKPLSPEEMTKFVQRSNEIMLMLTKIKYFQKAPLPRYQSTEDKGAFS